MNLDNDTADDGAEDFASFEKKAMAGELTDDTGSEGKDDTLELGGEDAPELTDEQKAEEEKRKTRTRDPIHRINVLTARLKEAERRAEALEARTAPAARTAAEAPARPDPAQFEFGEADPAYLGALTEWTVEARLADRDKRALEHNAAATTQQQVVGRLHEGMASVEKSGAERYDDFEAKIADAVEARGGEPLPPLVSIGIAVSPAGADIAYRLATDEAAAGRLERLSNTNPQQAAVAFGELEGEFVENDDDLNLGDPLDMARMLGRMRARLAGKGGGKDTVVERKVTKAPNPPEQRARGGGGKFEVADDTEDFAAFERKVMRGK